MPDGCTVYFFADFEKAYNSGPKGGGRAGNLKAIASDHLTQNVTPTIKAANIFQEGQPCTDYLLRKNPGSHGGAN